jgi:7-cyano-7-deazaguanine synthase
MILDTEPLKAVVLLSGGLDSATVAAIAQSEGYEVYAVSFDYGQRHKIELKAANRVAKRLGIQHHKTIRIDLNGVGGSALTDTMIDVPDFIERAPADIPITYVPARNLTFLSLALGWAEILGARRIYIGVNAVDYSGYPDCRPEFIHQFEILANIATATKDSSPPFRIIAPLQYMTKAQIIQAGAALGVDYSETISCYSPSSDGKACGRCDACHYRKQGFIDAGLSDTTRYAD